MDWQELKTNVIRFLVFLFLLIALPSAFGITWSKTGDNTREYLCMGLIVLLVILLWIFQKVTGIRNRYYVFGVMIGGGFAIAWQHTGNLTLALAFLAYCFVVLVLVYIYEKVNGQTIELVSENILVLIGTLIVGPAILILAAPMLFSQDTISVIIFGCFIALIAYPIFHRYMHPVPDNQLDEAYTEEIILPVPYEMAFTLCQQSAEFLPYGSILSSSISSGIVKFSASDSVGRTSRITATLQINGPKITKIKLTGVNEFIDSEYRIMTNRNEMFVKIIVRFLLEKIPLIGSGNRNR